MAECCLCRRAAALLWLHLLISSSSSVLAQFEPLIASTSLPEISYVIDPFESLDFVASDDLDNLTLSYNGLFGNFSLQVKYHYQVQEITRGESLFALTAENGTLYESLFGGAEEIEEDQPILSFGWLPPEKPHNCYGATHLSFWYKVLESRGDVIELRLTLLDDSDRDEENPQDLEHYFVSVPVETSSVVEEGDWQQVRIPMEDFILLEEKGHAGNGQLNLNRLRGWRFEVVKSEEGTIRGNSTTTDRRIILLLDQLACLGGGDLLGASLYTDVSWEEAASEAIWIEEYYNSDISRNNSEVVLGNGSLAVDFTVMMVESWGGFTALSYFAPGPAYYNLSGATDFHLTYHTREAATVPGRTHLRIVLSDASHCEAECSWNLFQHERWYSFHYVLDDDITNDGWGEIHMPLVGSLDPNTPLWLTKWAGITGNEQFDKDHLKGFTLEFNIDSQGEMFSTVSGALDMMDLSALVVTYNETSAEEASSTEASTCIVEPGVDLFTHISDHMFERKEFAGSICCSLCQEDENCLYAKSTGRDCFLASYLVADQVGLINTEAFLEDITIFWMNEEARRGNYCDLCNCREVDRTIDCRDSGLLVVPATLPYDLSWTPRVLDLRNNSNLVILGNRSMGALEETLEEVWLPKEMRHISPDSLKTLPKLTTIRYEGEEADKRVDFSNAILDPSDGFADICCAPGNHVELAVPATGISFCEMVVDQPGIDAKFMEFTTFQDATLVRKITPSSKFMFEAAESVYKCAEYCSIVSDCQYFGYDQRLPNAEHICLLQLDQGSGPLEVCCSRDHYADEEQTIPGFISGLPPRTRHTVDDARVLVAPKTIALNQETGYETSFQLSLGSTPLRGAVWVRPFISTISNLQVAFSPERVVLYDSNSTATVQVKVSNVTVNAKSVALLINNNVESCDVGFMQSTEAAANQETTVFIDVDMPFTEEESDLVIVVVICLAVIAALALGLFAYLERKRKLNDAVWKVKKSELIFDEPPEILGRGTFGLVLKATYRGTDVAVKRVIPPKDKCKRGSTTRSQEKAQMVDESRNIDASATERGGGERRSFGEGRIVMDSGERVSGGLRSSFDGRMSGTASMQQGSLVAMTGRESMTGRASVAKSTLLKSFSANHNRLRKEFVQEMRQLSKLRHPCITTVMGAVIDKKSEPMLVMELMDHGSLWDLLHNETMVLEGELLLPILRDISQGVRFLHAADPQVIHGDLKSQNILVDMKFRAKVSDFGLSQKKSLGGTGTPFWMAPELLRGEAANSTASDVYALGVILYEVYSRKDPYEGEDAREVLRLVADKKVNKRPAVPRHMPAPIQSLMADCLVEDRSQRPTLEELDTRLKRLDVKKVDPTQPANREKNSISLFDIFPRHIAEALRDGKQVEAEHRDCVTIFFSDIVGFTNISSTLPPRKVAKLLDRLYQQFDRLSHQHDLYKVETIGDAYMCCANLVKDQDDHVKRIAEFSVDAIAAAGLVRIDEDDPESESVVIRVGFHSGPVVADVVGTRNPRFCLFGDTVNVASRMESSSQPGRIHCSKASAKLLEEQCPSMPLTSRGKIHIKGKGDMHTFWVNKSGKRKSRISLNMDLLDLSGSELEECHPDVVAPALQGIEEEKSRELFLDEQECHPDVALTASLKGIEEEKSGELSMLEIDSLHSLLPDLLPDVEMGETKQVLPGVDKDGFTIGSFVDV